MKYLLVKEEEKTNQQITVNKKELWRELKEQENDFKLILYLKIHIFYEILNIFRACSYL